ncbi:MAG: TetR/AcrR family transcriptional regulator [Acinetobacter sp.]
MNKTSSPEHSENTKKKKRVRLTPEIRRKQILDAALIEFSSLGYTAASISKIAQRAEMSKANLYVHFANKEEIFETLLTHVLVPPTDQASWIDNSSENNLTQLIDHFIDQSYDSLTPHSIAVIRLLISESHRIPHLIHKWYAEFIIPFRNSQNAAINKLVDEGKIYKNPFTEGLSFSMAPILYAAVVHMFFPKDMAEIEFHKIKETHRKILHLLLTPKALS